jgi:ATP-binding cassette subfamily C (CFTR/MRP) protein 4
MIGRGKYEDIEHLLDSGTRENLDLDHHDAPDEEAENESDEQIQPSPASLNVQDTTKISSGRATEKSESQTTGIVSIKIYWKYFKAGNGILILSLLLLSALTSQAFSTGSDYFLKVW